jgi:Ca2+-binding EF-hand superfamily protein
VHSRHMEVPFAEEQRGRVESKAEIATHKARARARRALRLLALTNAKKSLRSKLSKSLASMLDWFQTWDEDGNGTVDKHEFRLAISKLGWAPPDLDSDQVDEICDHLFAEMDTDGSGVLEYREYIRFALRNGLARACGRVLDLFRQWDKDGSGLVERSEFHRAIREIGFHAPSSELDALFDEIDRDRSGIVDYAELHALLRQGGAVKLAKVLQNGPEGGSILQRA